MRRFSQRNALVTLSEINITPLLDLAFVLLIIFVITTPLLEQGLNLRLPQSNSRDTQQIDKNDVVTVDISKTGQFVLKGRAATLDQVENALIALHRANPELVVFIRADNLGLNRDTYAIIDRCQRNGITRFSLRTEPIKGAP
ncbi:MAG: biopolymer transporter ExbD [Verrucomicrobia bacterium]|nr:biopolymer transporter ExbD [Verrucomicrobiota bacterium]